MELKLFLTAGALLAMSCTNSEDLYMPESESSVVHVSQVRTAIDAIEIATQIAEMDNQQTRSSKTVSHFNVRPILAKGTRSTASDTVMYAINFENNQGFVLISADKRVSPVLAVIDSGSYEDAANAENEGFQYALESMISYASVPKEPVIPNPTNRPLIITARPKTEPVAKLNLNQYWPMGMYCPNGISGCGPLVATQVLAAMQLPTSILYTYPECDKVSEEIDWSKLSSHKSNVSFEGWSIFIDEHMRECPLNMTGHKTLGRIAREIGYLAGAGYFKNENKDEGSEQHDFTSTTSDNIVYVIQNLSGKTAVKLGSNIDDLFESLASNNKRIALVRGDYTNNPAIKDGHVWIADAIWEIGQILRYEWIGVIDPENPDNPRYYDVGSIDQYIHFNWGRNQNCNGFFLLGVFNPNNGYEYDNESGNSFEDVNWQYNIRFTTFEI